jgi:hypothetical protein
LKHLTFSHSLHFLHWHCPLPCLFLPFLFYHVRQYLCSIHILSIQQISRNGTFFHLISLHFYILFFMSLDLFPHSYLFFILLLIKDLCLYSSQSLSFTRFFMMFTCFLLSPI